MTFSKLSAISKKNYKTPSFIGLRKEGKNGKYISYRYKFLFNVASGFTEIFFRL